MKLINLLLLTLLLNVYCQEILNTQDKNGQNITFSFGKIYLSMLAYYFYSIQKGSCFSERRTNSKISIFNKISKYNPDIFAWLGDASYSKLLDDAVHSFNFTKNEQGYRMLYDNNITSIVGTWDDHDYGKNDGKVFFKRQRDKYYKHKNEMRQIYLDFLDEPKNSIRRTQPGGIYTSYYIGKTKQIKLVLLDVRFSRDSFWLEHEDVLGKDQWDWLENQFNDKNSNILFLASGCQLIPDDRIIPEKWYPKSRERLYDLIEKHKQSKRVIILSGDIHFGEIIVEPESFKRFGYNLIEITSSGLTHSLAQTWFPLFLVEGFLPNTFNEKKDRYFGKNFAIVDIQIDEKNKENTSLHFKIQDENDKTQLEIKLIPWQKNQKMLKLSDSKFTRADHISVRWLSQMKQNYFVDYKNIGIILTIILLSILVIGVIIVRKVWRRYKLKQERKEKKTE